MPNNQPYELASKLASNKLAGNPNRNPSGKPLYSVKCKLKSGEPAEFVDPQITRALIALMDMTAVIGGAASHYGGPAAFAELMSAVHGLAFLEAQSSHTNWFDLFHILNDAGHCENGLYALKANYGLANLSIQDLRGFRSINSKLTGHGEAHLFPEAVLLSNGPLGSTLPQAQGLAMADALTKKNRVTITAISDGACMEGEAREAMASIPGLALKGKMAPFIMVISDNNTKLSGRIDQESFSMQPSFKALTALGWKVLNLEDGHDLQKCVSTLEEALKLTRENPTVPVAIHAKTIKGIGCKKTAESSSGGHGFPLKSAHELPEFLKEIMEGKQMPEEFLAWAEDLIKFETETKAKTPKASTPEEKIQVGVSSALIKLRKNGLPIVSISADLPGSTGMAGFRKEFPQDSFDIGVAESNMVSVAAGFSKAGFLPVVDTFAQFGVTKGALPMTMAMLSEAPMICIYSHTGFQDAADGASHQALSYVAMSSSIPGVECILLTCSDEAESLVTQAAEKFIELRRSGKNPPSYVFFLGRENFPKSFAESGALPAKYELGRAQLVRESSGKFERFITLVGSGSMLGEALKAAKSLENQKIGSLVINPSVAVQKDFTLWKSCLEKSNGNIVFLEDHQAIGGINQMLMSQLTLEGLHLKTVSLAVPGEFGQSAYNAIDLYKHHKMDAQAIVAAAKKLIPL